MQKERSLIACIIIICLLIVSLSFQCKGTTAEAEEKPVAVISAIEVGLQMKHKDSGDWSTANIKTPVFPGDILRTGAKEKACLTFNDGIEVFMNYNTSLEIPEKRDKPIRLKIGEILLKTDPQKAKPEVETPAAVAAVRGTIFDLKADENKKSTLTVVKGEVSFANKRGGVVVKKSEQSQATPETAPAKPRIVDVKNVIKWTESIRFSLELTYEPHFANQEKLNEAEERYQKILSQNPEDAQAQQGLGDVLSDRGKAEEAVSHYEKAISLSPNLINSYIGIAQEEMVLSNYEKALSYFNKAIKIDNKNIKAWMGAGDAQLALGNFEDTLSNYEGVLKINPGYAKAENGLGIVYFFEGNFPLAEEKFQKAIQLNKRFAWAYSNLGAAQEVQGKVSEATNSFKKAIEIDKNLAPAWNSLGVIYAEKGNYKEAEKCFIQAVNLGTETEKARSLTNLGYLYDCQARIEDALKEYQSSIEINPDDPLPHLNLSSVYKSLGQMEKAKAECEKAVGLAPDNVSFLAELARILWAQGDYSEAKAYCQKAINIDREDPWPHLILGFIYESEGEKNKAKAGYETAYNLRPKKVVDATGYFRLSLLSYYSGRIDESIKQLLEAIKLNPSRYDFCQNLGRIYFEKKNYKEAEKYLLGAVKLNNNDIISHQILGRIYFEGNRLSEAEEQYKIAISIDANDRFAHYWLATIYQKQGKNDEAIGEFLIAAKIAEPYPEQAHLIWRSLGILYEDKGDLQKAKEAYEKAISLNPNEAEDHYLLGLLYERLGNNEKAIEELQKAKALAGDNMELYKSIVDELKILQFGK